MFYNDQYLTDISNGNVFQRIANLFLYYTKVQPIQESRVTRVTELLNGV